MGDIVVYNGVLEALLNTWVTSFMDAGASLAVFENDFIPDPESEYSDFVPATFGGYAPVNLSGQWYTSFKVIDGKYQRDSLEFTFTVTSTPTNTVYGWFVHSGTGTGAVRMSGRFPAPIVLAVGSTFRLTLSPQTWSLSII